MTQKRILYLLQQPPYLSDRVFEAIDALLVTAAFDQEVSLLFRGAGLQQLLKQQHPRNQRNLAKMLGALSAYEIDQLYVDAQDWHQAGLTASDCAISPTPLAPAELTALIARQHVVLHD